LDYIRKLWADPLTMAEVGGPIRVDPEQARGWYARMVSPGEETDRYFLIFNEEGRPVGEISFHRYDKDAGCAEFNIKIEAGQRGRGYAGKAVPLLLRYFFCEFGGKTMLDPVARDNRPGQEALTRLGFKRDHSRQDVCLLFMTKGEFISIYGR
jgi:RimJ/RimL family protein N-acetyltransferase